MEEDREEIPPSNLLLSKTRSLHHMLDSNLFASNSCHAYGNKITTGSKI